MADWQPARVTREPGRGYLTICHALECRTSRRRLLPELIAVNATHNGAHHAKALHNRAHLSGSLSTSCVCGRTFAKRFGKGIHQRTCKVYRAQLGVSSPPVAAAAVT